MSLAPLSSSSSAQVASISGVGLITGENAAVSIQKAPTGSGILFWVNGQALPCQPEYVTHTDRGVILGSGNTTLCLVEHFLAACGMLECWDWHVSIEGAPELPILDGSALGWVEKMQPLLQHYQPEEKRYPLTQTVSSKLTKTTSKGIQPYCVAIPNPNGFELSCMIDFDHPDISQRWIHLKNTETNWLQQITPARTFGFVRELPAIQAQGLAKGVSLENTIGLNDDGSYTTELRFSDECLRHKVLDFIGDMTLWQIPLLKLDAHIIICCSGHTLHYQFGQQLKQALTTAC